MPLIEKEIIAPGSYFYVEEKTGLPRRLDVTPDLTKYWRDQGKEMLSAGLTIPVPYEHDFNLHPMTPKDKLLNNAGWAADYKVKDAPDGRKDVLYSVLDVQDEEVAKKLPNTIRYTSPWINSFTDGNGRHWRNVISHIALTTRPRVTKQAPFGSIAAALSMADTVSTLEPHQRLLFPEGGACLSRAGRVVQRKADKRLFAVYPMAFSLFTGAALGSDDVPPKKAKGSTKPPVKEGGAKPGEPPAKGESEYEEPSGSSDSSEVPGAADKGAGDVDLPPLGEKAGDVSMEEVLCDLLRALGVDCQHDGNEEQFKRNLYMAAMKKVHDLTNKGMNPDQPQPGQVNKGNPPGNQPNPIITQEQQPMYMALSLEDINKLEDPNLKAVALSMYTEREVMKKKIEGLEAQTLKQAGEVRAARVARLSAVSPKVKADLDALLAQPSMALSMGDGGVVVDPMEQTLKILETGLGALTALPALLTTPAAALAVAPHPTDDANELSQEQIDAIIEQQVRNMGAVPEQKKAG